MILYTTLGVADVDRAARFYDSALQTLGHARRPDMGEGWAAWGPSYDEGAGLYICAPFDGGKPSAGNGTMIALRAHSAAEVRAFHVAALEAGGTDEGAPGTRPEYGPSFYVAYVRDLDGNKLACVYHHYDPAADIG